MSDSDPILPGATLGMLGGGQLGRFFVIAARQMGYRVIVLDPDAQSPAGGIADEHVCAQYDDAAALARLASECAAVTTEFESVPAAALERLSGPCRVAPAAECVAIAQDRLREKRFLQSNGFPVGAFVAIESDADVPQRLDGPAILKRATHGYDGKGQVPVQTAEELRAAWLQLGRAPCVLEQRLPLDLEVSVVLARAANGDERAFTVSENHHRSGILDTSTVPARVSPALAAEARALTEAIAARLGYVGVIGVEFFITGGKLLVNEIAPRPHNSGHYTLDACVTSQFEQQVRALCGLPLGEPDLLAPAVMVNVLGDALLGPEAPWNDVLALPGAKLHLYGKTEARPGRKMGHVTFLGTQSQPSAERFRSMLSDWPRRP